MKKKIISLVLIFLLLGYLSFKAANKSQYWLRTEDNGIVYHVDYLHELCKKQPAKAKQYLGKKISLLPGFVMLRIILFWIIMAKSQERSLLPVPRAEPFLLRMWQSTLLHIKRGSFLRLAAR